MPAQNAVTDTKPILVWSHLSCLRKPRAKEIVFQQEGCKTIPHSCGRVRRNSWDGLWVVVLIRCQLKLPFEFGAQQWLPFQLNTKIVDGNCKALTEAKSCMQVGCVRFVCNSDCWFFSGRDWKPLVWEDFSFTPLPVYFFWRSRYWRPFFYFFESWERREHALVQKWVLLEDTLFPEGYKQHFHVVSMYLNQ